MPVDSESLTSNSRFPLEPVICILTENDSFGSSSGRSVCLATRNAAQVDPSDFGR